MANYTTTQLKKRTKTLKDKLEALREELEELKSDIEEESSEIEPYEGKEDLTPQQEARQEWLDNSSGTLETVISSLEDSESDLESILED